jgi:phosphate transport system permease protein
MSAIYFATFVTLVLVAFFSGRNRAVAAAGAAKGLGALHSLPVYHGLLAAACVSVLMLIVYVVGMPLTQWLARTSALGMLPAEIAGDDLKRIAALRDILDLASGRKVDAGAELQEAARVYANVRTTGVWSVLALGAALGIGILALILSRIGRLFRARNLFEQITLAILIACALVAILTTVGIIFSVVTETWRFFFDPHIKGKPSVTEFLFGTEWNPQEALRDDQGDFRAVYGFVPLLVGTLLITFIAICVAGPIGLFSAIYLSEYASPRVRAFFKPVLETLAGIPTVVLGFFAALAVAPLIRNLGESAGLTDVASESALAAGLVMGMMIIPFISSLSDDVINAVPQSLRDGSYALGSTKSETIRRVVLAAALPGIVSAFMLAISRAIGETMIVVMAAGLAGNLTFNPLHAVTTITVQIKVILVGDQEFDSAKTLAAFALGFVLFFVTLALNYIALRIVRAYREQYE